MATVYEVCAIVMTVFLGVLAFEAALAVYSLRKLTEEARHTLQNANVQLPALLENVLAVARKVRVTSELVEDGVSRAAAGMAKVKGEPLLFLVNSLAAVKEGLSLWEKIRARQSQPDK
ncbi:Hypothetical protein DEACI_0705 [Acididesulfobacillus acetoxydans]|uniref:DUF948 domain-containing protein n=1 Tax=Acididesulfobacillus acetoxydans TaxID=1561005 RepID=A0A8S0XAL3_9FIRM|nr:hypothetical protein [Acididesulfobacillus acetoxydans]CAA7600056.1 Hypothetical protein DEACI_0705 [Acididesulfobacillus acetoxydans]CEJ07831.1 Hypothetical protein DEACI_2297 [Acididesulfobacillus acetoxydans]